MSRFFLKWQSQSVSWMNRWTSRVSLQQSLSILSIIVSSTSSSKYIVLFSFVAHECIEDLKDILHTIISGVWARVPFIFYAHKSCQICQTKFALPIMKSLNSQSRLLRRETRFTNTNMYTPIKYLVCYTVVSYARMFKWDELICTIFIMYMRYSDYYIYILSW